MRISRYAFAAILACSAFGWLQAVDSINHSKKHYLDEKSISITDQGIIVKTKNGPVRTSVLHSDEKGIYVFKEDCICVEKRGEQYVRSRCRCGRWFKDTWYLQKHLEAGECEYGRRR